MGERGWQDDLKKNAPLNRTSEGTTRSNSLAMPPLTPILMLNCFGLSSGRGSAWLERLVRDQEVGGSNPLAPIFQ